jgi:hypothetical protein
MDPRLRCGVIVFQSRVLAIGITALLPRLFVPTSNVEAQEANTSVTCTNPISGASWQITIDLDKATVDSNRASISDAKIAWFDVADGSNYTLDRKSGDLTAVVASSTGGYFRHGRCNLEKLR